MTLALKSAYSLLPTTQDVDMNTSAPSSVLKKRQNAIAYHQVQEGNQEIN
jgi:hypothetical protein